MYKKENEQHNQFVMYWKKYTMEEIGRKLNHKTNKDEKKK